MPCSAHCPRLLSRGASGFPIPNVPDSRFNTGSLFTWIMTHPSGFSSNAEVSVPPPEARSSSSMTECRVPDAFSLRRRGGGLRLPETSGAEPQGSVGRQQPRCAQRALSPPGGSGRYGFWSFHEALRGLALPLPQNKSRPRVPWAVTQLAFHEEIPENSTKPNWGKIKF